MHRVRLAGKGRRAEAAAGQLIDTREEEKEKEKEKEKEATLV